MSLALYRKYRPGTFAEVKGQEHVTEPLRQALRTGRIHHAYLFSGPARMRQDLQRADPRPLAQLREGPTPDPCGECESCVALAPDRPRPPRRRSRSTRPRTAAWTTPATCGSGRSSRRSPRATRSTSSTRRTWSPARVQRAAEARRGAAAAPEVRLRDHRAGEGHRDDQVADPPLPVPADPAVLLRALWRRSCDAEGVAVEPAALPLVVRAGGGSARDSLSILDQLLAGSDERGITYQRAVALLGYTDADLLDEIVDAFARRTAPRCSRPCTG